jgi:hypothetical protein
MYKEVFKTKFKQRSMEFTIFVFVALALFLHEIRVLLALPYFSLVADGYISLFK